jgi:hypothetical protein
MGEHGTKIKLHLSRLNTLLIKVYFITFKKLLPAWGTAPDRELSPADIRSGCALHKIALDPALRFGLP